MLGRHVVLLRGGQASRVDYIGFAANRSALKAYLSTLSSVSVSTFGTFSKSQQKAFLINAYNAFTIELVLTRYPNLKSIREIGGLFSNPWKSKWITLLSSGVSLDDIEHTMLRKRGVYDDPLIHFGVNCASVGCPMLREEAYVADRLDRQLEQQTHRFLGDRSRNRWNPQARRVELSKIFEWYEEDFRSDHRGISSLKGFVAKHSDLLSDDKSAQDLMRSGMVEIDFLNYDWSLNDI